MTKRILIAGDSWGLGEWSAPHIDGVKALGNPHGGLAQFLQEDGHTIWNISQGGLCNFAITERIANWMINFHERNIDMIIMFATEYTRDMAYEFPLDWADVKSATDLSGICLSRSYYRLRDLALTWNVPIYLIGGVVDTVWLDRWDEHYPGVKVVCQSMVELILEGNHRIDKPVYSWYGAKAIDTVQRLKKHLPSNEVEALLDLIEQGYNRQNRIFENPEFFWPDGIHANRHGHRKLYEFLRDQKLFD